MPETNVLTPIEALAGVSKTPVLFRNPATPPSEKDREIYYSLSSIISNPEPNTEFDVERKKFELKPSLHAITEDYCKTDIQPNGDRHSRPGEHTLMRELNDLGDLFVKYNEEGFESLTNPEKDRLEQVFLDSLHEVYPEYYEAANRMGAIRARGFARRLLVDIGESNIYSNIFVDEMNRQYDSGVFETHVSSVEKAISTKMARISRIEAEQRIKEADISNKSRQVQDVVVKIDGFYNDDTYSPGLGGAPSRTKSQVLTDLNSSADVRDYYEKVERHRNIKDLTGVTPAEVTAAADDIKTAIDASADVREFLRLQSEIDGLNTDINLKRTELMNAETGYTDEQRKFLGNEKEQLEGLIDKRVLIRDRFAQEVRTGIMARTMEKIYFGENGELAVFKNGYPDALKERAKGIHADKKVAMDGYTRNRYKTASVMRRSLRGPHPRDAHRRNARADAQLLIDGEGNGHIELAKETLVRMQAAGAIDARDRYTLQADNAFLDQYGKDLIPKVIFSYANNGGVFSEEDRKKLEEMYQKPVKDTFKTIHPTVKHDEHHKSRFSRTKDFMTSSKLKKAGLMAGLVTTGVLGGYALAGSIGVAGVVKGIAGAIIDTGTGVYRGYESELVKNTAAYAGKIAIAAGAGAGFYKYKTMSTEDAHAGGHH